MANEKAQIELDLEDEVEVRVWDSSAEIRYLVLPERPAGTDDLDEMRATDSVAGGVES